MSSTSTFSPEMRRRPENASLSSTMGTSASRDCRESENQWTETASSTAPSASTPSSRTGCAAVSTAPSASPSPSGTGCFNALAAVLLVQISSFSPESNLSGVCRSTLSAIRNLHYTVNIPYSFSDGDEGHMGVQESGALATGRVVTRITVLVGSQEVNMVDEDSIRMGGTYPSTFCCRNWICFRSTGDKEA